LDGQEEEKGRGERGRRGRECGRREAGEEERVGNRVEVKEEGQMRSRRKGGRGAEG